jgi:hypothetical protein
MANEMYPFEVKGFRDPGPAPLDFSDKRVLVVPSKDWHNSYRLLTEIHKSWRLTKPVSQKTRMRRFMESDPMRNLSAKFHELTGTEISAYALEELIRHSRIRCNGHDIDAIADKKSNIHIFLGAYPWVAEARTWVEQNA